MTEARAAEQPMTPEPEKKDEEAPELPAVPESAGTDLAITNKEKSELLWNLAQKYALSGIVPEIFRDKPHDCFIAMQMATRMKVDAMMLMQSAFLVHNKLGFEAKFVVGLMNNSDLIMGRLKYEEAPEPGTDPFDNKYAVRAFATDKETGQDVYGEWITWVMVRAEGWESKSGSKWKTMPGQMFHYRAATFFIRRHYPEVLLGMQTTEEILDADFTVTNIDRTQALKDRIAAPAEDAPAAETDPSKECPHCKGRLLAGETTDCPHCDKPLMEKVEEEGKTVGDIAEESKQKQGKLWSLCEQISGGKVIETEKVMLDVAGTIQLEKIHGEDLDTAIGKAEIRLQEKSEGKPKGKGKGKEKKTGDLFEK